MAYAASPIGCWTKPPTSKPTMTAFSEGSFVVTSSVAMIASGRAPVSPPAVRELQRCQNKSSGERSTGPSSTEINRYGAEKRERLKTRLEESSDRWTITAKNTSNGVDWRVRDCNGFNLALSVTFSDLVDYLPHYPECLCKVKGKVKQGRSTKWLITICFEKIHLIKIGPMSIATRTVKLNTANWVINIYEILAPSV